jgi:hypothetical protein
MTEQTATDSIDAKPLESSDKRVAAGLLVVGAPLAIAGLLILVLPVQIGQSYPKVPLNERHHVVGEVSVRGGFWTDSLWTASTRQMVDVRSLTH